MHYALVQDISNFYHFIKKRTGKEKDYIRKKSWSSVKEDVLKQNKKDMKRLVVFQASRRDGLSEGEVIAAKLSQWSLTTLRHCYGQVGAWDTGCSFGMSHALNSAIHIL